MKYLKPKNINNKLYHFFGAIYIFLNYLRRSLSGYSNPRGFHISQISRSIEYDFEVVEGWVNYLQNYSNETEPLKNKVVLELGPGPDLGIGLIMLAMGVKKYVAIDVNKLIGSASSGFYKKMFQRLKEKFPDCDIEELKVQLEKCYRGEDSKLNYIVDKDFTIPSIGNKIDIALSHCAFEHFDNVGETIEEISNAINKDGILYARIDLCAHGRLFGMRDPLNYYRFSNRFWNALKYPGTCNRLRTPQYEQFLEANDWSDIQIEPVRILEKEYVEKIKPTLNDKFRNLDVSEMQILGFILMARKN